MKMICPECKKEYDTNHKFCAKCGVQLQEIVQIKEEESEASTEPKVKSGKSKNKLLISTIVILTIIVLGIIIFLSDYLSPKEKMLRLLDAKEYKAAVKIYEKELAGDVEAEEKLTDSIEERVLQIQDDYINENVDYDTAKNLLATIADMDIDVPSYQTVSSYVEKLQTSRDAYQKAENFLALEDYVEALRQYKLVEQIDENYSDAQNKISTCKQNYKTNILSKAEEYVAAGNYFNAVQGLNNALSVLETDTDIETLIITYKKDEISVTLKSYEQAGDYVGAIEYGRAHQSEIDAEPELSSLLDSYLNKYREEVLAQAENAFANEGYASAINVLQSSKSILENDEIVLSAIEHYKTYIPVALQDLAVIEAYTAEFEGDACEDLYGNKYVGYYDLCSFGGSSPRSAYVEFLTNEQYQYISGTFFARPKMNGDFTISFQIYADDVLVYDSGAINRKTEAINFTVDIQKAKFVKIMSKSGDRSYGGTNPGIILTNASVHN